MGTQTALSKLAFLPAKIAPSVPVPQARPRATSCVLLAADLCAIFMARFVAMTLPGECITCTGRIAGKVTRDGETLVRIALAAVNQAGETKVAGEALVALR